MVGSLGENGRVTDSNTCASTGAETPTQVFASRILEGPGGPWTLRFNQPQTDGKDWFVPCSLLDSNQSQIWSLDFWGVDAFQALQFAFFGLRARFPGDDPECSFLGERGTGILETVIPQWMLETEIPEPPDSAG